MAHWHAYLCVPEVLWDDAAPIVEFRPNQWFWIADGMVITNHEFQYGVYRNKLREAKITFAMCTFNGEDHQPRDRYQSYYDREGVNFECQTEWNLSQQNLFYYQFRESVHLHNTQCYQMAFSMMGHHFNVSDDLRHFTAMARLRQALTN